MQTRKIPMRTCVVTKEKWEKRELMRIVRTPEGEVLVDETGKKMGKGPILNLLKKWLKRPEKIKL